MSTDTTLKAPVTVAPVVATPQSVPAAQAAQVKPASSEVEVKEKSIAEIIAASGYKSEDYDGAIIVVLKLNQPDIMQYDSVYKLKLDSTEPTAMPLTPFFAARLNSTVSLCS